MSHRQLCNEDYCPQCGAPCERLLDHEGQHKCINCGCRWTSEQGESGGAEQ